jgi:iron complex outermembrane receptor protein
MGLSSNYHKGILSGNSLIYCRESQNDFSRTLPNGVTEPQPHARFATKGFQQGISLTAKNGLTANATFWLARTDRQIPPTLSQLQGSSTQLDETLRLQASVSKVIGNITVLTDAAFDKGALDYIDPIADIFDTSRFTTVHIQSKLSAGIKGFDLSAIGIYRSAKAWSDNYEGIPRRNSPAWVLSAQRSLFDESTFLSATLRGEWLNGHFLPLVPTFGFTRNIGRQFQLKANAGKIYRIPGLNDLYWNPGGNDELLPESGWSEEVGIHFHKPKHEIQLSFSGFNRNVNNWIIWIPGPSYWSPENLRTVWSRGLELQASAKTDLSKHTLAHRLEYTFVRSTVTGSIRPDDKSLQNQLIYTPEHSVLIEERLESKNYSLTAIAQFQSRRFTNNDNTEALNPFFVVHMIAEVKWAVRSLEGSVSLTARNLLNQDYVMVINRPLPGRHYLATLQFNLNKSKKPTP